MLHEVTFEVFDPAARLHERHTVTVDADGGDDAASKGALEAAVLADGAAFKIIAVAPAGSATVAGAAAVEGADA